MSKIKSVTLLRQSAMDDVKYEVGVDGISEINDWGNDESGMTCYAFKKFDGLKLKIENAATLVEYF